MSGSWTPIACCRTLDRQRDSYGIILGVAQFKARAMDEVRTWPKEYLSRLNREREVCTLRYNFADES